MRQLFFILAVPLCLSFAIVQGEVYPFSGPRSAQGFDEQEFEFQRGPLLRERGRGQKLFDPLTVISIDGEITKVDKVNHRRGTGIHLFVQSNGKDYSIPVGPDWYMDRINLSLQPDQNVQIQGSVINRNGKEFLVPIRITSGGKTYILRDSNGRPAWRGQGKGFRGNSF